MNFIYDANRIYAQDEQGRLLAEITFPHVNAGVVDINHTFVDDSLRGQGVADRLIRAALDHIRAQGWLVTPTCPYAVKRFERHTEAAGALYVPS